MTVRYEVTANNEVEVFYPGAEAPSLRQPHWPNGAAWADAAEAAAWGALYVASINDENAPFAPSARGETGKAKATAEQKAAFEAAQATLAAAKTREEIEEAEEALRTLVQSF